MARHAPETWCASGGAHTRTRPAEPGHASRTASAELIRVEDGIRRCTSREALWQHLVNETGNLLPLEQAIGMERPANAGARWTTAAVSALPSVNRDSPLIRWYEDIARNLWSQCEDAKQLQDFELPTYADPEDPCTADATLRHLLWVPLFDADQPVRGAWILARATAWDEGHKKVATHLAGAYAHGLSAIDGRVKPTPAWTRHRGRLAAIAIAGIAAMFIVRVPLTTLAPVEVTPQDPFVVSAPVVGVVDRIVVTPGAQVQTGTPLVQFVDTTLRSDYDVANQKVEVARARILRLQHAAIEDPQAKRELAIARAEETVAVAERDYAHAMLQKSVLRAKQAGVAIFGDPRDWVGRPVAVGEAIMRVANPEKVEYQIKVPVADAVNLRQDARVKVFLDAAPLRPLEARIVQAAYQAETDAAGVASFTVVARLVDPNAPAERLGLRGTAHVYGEPVSLIYYLLRRPITAVRQMTGI